MKTDYYEEKKAWIARDFGWLEGKTIAGVRPLTKQECEMFLWDFNSDDYAMVIIFTDGTCVIPSSDPEGNSGGFLIKEQVA